MSPDQRGPTNVARPTWPDQRCPTNTHQSEITQVLPYPLHAQFKVQGSKQHPTINFHPSAPQNDLG